MATVGEAFIEIQADTDNLRRALSRDLERILDRIDATVEVEAEISRRAIRSFEDSLSQLDGSVVDVAAELEDSSLDEFESQFASLDGEIIEAIAEVDDAELDTYESSVQSLMGQIIDSVAQVDDAEVDSIASEIASLDGSIIDLVVAVGDGDLDAVRSSVASLNGSTIGLNLDVDDSELQDIQADGAVNAAGAGLLAGGASFGPAAAGITALGVSVGFLAGEAIELESGLNEIASLQIPGFGFDEARETVAALVAETGVASEDAIPALYNALSAQVPPDNVLDFLISSQDLAIAGVAELEDAARISGTAIRVFGEEAGSQEEIVNSFFGTVQSGVTTIPEIAEAFGQFAPVASALGLSLNETNAALATSTQITGNTARSATGLNQVLLELQDSGSNVSSVFEDEVGQSISSFISEGGSLQEVLSVLSDEADASGVSLNEFFGSSEAGVVALQLARNDGENFIETLENIEAISGDALAVEAAVAINEDSLGVQFAQLSSRIQGFFGDAILGLTPFLTSAVSGLNNLLEGLDFGAIFSSIGSFGSSVARVFSSLFRSIGGGEATTRFLSAFTDRLSEIGELLGRLDFGSIDFSFIASGLRVVVDLFFGFQELITEFISDNQDALVNIFDAVVEIFNALGGVLESLFELISDNQDTIFAVFNFLGEVFVFIAEALALVLPPLIEFIGFLVELSITVLGPLINIIGEVIEFFFDLGSTILNILTQVEGLPEAIAGFFGSLPGIIGGFVVSIGVAAAQVGAAIFDSVSGFVTNLPGAISSAFNSVISGIRGLVGSAFSAAIDFGRSIFDGIVEGISGTAGALADIGRQVANAIIGFVNNSVIDRINSALEFRIPIPGAPDININPPDLPGIPLLADGGIITAATTAIVGEAGAEAVIPLTRPARALALLRESGLDTLLFENLAEQGSGTNTSINASADSTTNNNVVNNVEINVDTQEGQDSGLIAESLLTELSSSGSRGLAAI